MTSIYEPAQDTFLLEKALIKNLKDKNLRILEVGVGSGYLLKILKEKGFKNLSGIDINPVAVQKLSKNFKVKESNLFLKVKEKFDIIYFNPPYLPKDKLEDEDSRLATTGGKYGSEVINRFLKEAKNHLNKKGKIFLLTSSLTKNINWQNYKKTKVAEKKLFFEKLFVWQLII